MTHQSYPPWFYHPNNVISFIMQLSPASCHFFPLCSKYYPQHPVLRHLQATYELELSGRPNWMKSSRAISRVSCHYKTDVSKCSFVHCRLSDDPAVPIVLLFRWWCSAVWSVLWSSWSPVLLLLLFPLGDVGQLVLSRWWLPSSGIWFWLIGQSLGLCLKWR